MAGESPQITDDNDHWRDLFNNKIDSLDKLYSSDAVLIPTAGERYDKATERMRFYANLKKAIGSISSATTLQRVDVSPTIQFEIGTFISSAGGPFRILIIRKKEGARSFRAVEIIEPYSANDTGSDIIEAARKNWMNLCNDHNVNGLVSRSYASNAFYYNNNRLLQGTAEIAREYKYMNNPSYQLTLTPIVLEVVNDNVAFEIGQCSGSYQGKYTLVWKKVGDIWKVIFDSN